MEATTQKLSVTRTIRASRQRVFRAWTEPELMLRWFVEADWEMSLCQIDLREGGQYRFEGAIGGRKWAVWGTYLEVRPPDRLVYTWIWEHDYGFGDPTGDTQVTVEFRESGTETEIVLTHDRFDSVRAREDHADGWKTCLDRIERLLSE